MTEQVTLTALLGEESRPVEFSTGLIGLEEWRRFVLIVHPAGEPLRLLQSLEDPRLSLIIANPGEIVPDYQLRLTETDVQALQYSGESRVLLSDQGDMEVYCILSVQEDPFTVTANLLGPLVINWQTGLGRQVILSDSNYNSRHPLAVHPSSQSPSNAPEERQTV